MGRKGRKKIKKKSNSQEDNSNAETRICQLNDDCLRSILAYLPFKDRLRLQRVSKKWQALMPWNVHDRLVVHDNNFRVGRESWMPCSLSVLEKVLCLCGNFLTDVKVAFWYDVSRENAEHYLKMFKNLCPNLVELDLHNFNLTKPLIKFLIQNFADLKSFGIGGDFARGCEKEITKFFTKTKNLREIKFSQSTFRGTCLTALPLVSIEKFKVSGSKDMLLGNVCKAFQNMNNLRTLHIKNNLVMIENFDRILEELLDRSKLESLKLYVLSIPDREKIVQMKNLRYLTNLQELFLHGPQVVHDEALSIIGNTCTKLKKATLRDSHKLTDNGWKNFAKLTNIETLTIGQLDTISDKCFNYLQASSLKTLICYKISLITNRSLQVLLKSAKNLNRLDVELCPQVDRATLIEDVSAQLQSRPTCEIFTLRIEIYDSTAKVTNISSLMNVENTIFYIVKFERKQRQISPEDALANF